MLEARDGEVQAFARLYDRYAGLIRAVAYDRCGDRVHAGELAQEAFLRAYHGLDQLRDPTRLLPWLIRITHNVSLEAIRQAGRQRSAVDAARRQAREYPAEPGLDPLEQQDLLDAVAALPEPDRTAIRLYYLCEQPADQARGVLGLSRSGFYKVLNRAKQTLRRQLDPASGAEA